MKLFRAVALVCGFTFAGAAFTMSARADEWNKKPVSTLSGPVDSFGVHLAGFGTLPAGTYVFKILDSQSDRHIFQIFNKYKTNVYATILDISNYRLKATDETVVAFRERPAGEPEALRAWFYPGDHCGEAFVHGKSKAPKITEAPHMPVLLTKPDNGDEVTEPIQSADHVAVIELNPAPVMAITPAGEEVAVVETVTPLPEQVSMAPAQTFPATSSSLPPFSLLGSAALSGEAIVTAAGKRS